MALTLRTQLPVEEAARRVTDAIVNGSFSAELVAQSDSRGPDGAQCVTLLFDKYFLRAGTKTGLFDLFDWGAGDDFEEEVRAAIEG